MFSKKTWQRGDSYIFLPVLKLLCDKVEEEIGTPVPSYDQMPRIVKFIISEKNEKDTPERKAKIISSVEAVVKQLQKFVG
jgi:hypothetical protein